VIIALLAACSMFTQDVLAVCLVQAEARNRAGLAALLDAVMWGAAITTTSISVTTLQGHSLGHKVAVVAAVSAANLAGSWTGVMVGKRLIRETAKACTCVCPVHGEAP
jgi:hypothetical protein